jgi:hypothetical protein
VLFAGIGFVLTVPMLLKLRKRFGSWVAPGVALALFAIMFTISTLWIGPALRGDGGSGDSPADPHHASMAPEGFGLDVSFEVSLVDFPPAHEDDFRALK